MFVKKLLERNCKHEHSIQPGEHTHLKEQKPFNANYFLSKLDGHPDYLEPNNDLKCQVENMAYNTKREISRSDFKIDVEIGSGNFGKVCKGEVIGLYDSNSTTTVAIKSIHGLGNEIDLNDLLCEIKLMGCINPHPNLVSMIGSCSSELKVEGKLWLLIEYCEYGDLRNYLKSNKEKIIEGKTSDAINSRCLLKWLHGIGKGMEYLAENKIMHGDLAARNVLMASNILEDDCPLVKIADFGLAKKLYDYLQYEKTSRMLVPWKWMAIEYLKNDFFTPKSDVWSYGVLIWEVLSFGQNPYGHQTYDEVLQRLETGYRLPYPDVIDVSSWSPETLYEELCGRCFVEDSENRANFEEVVQIIERHLFKEEKSDYNEMARIYQQNRANNYLKKSKS